MNKIKKIFFIISISLNIVLLVFFIFLVTKIFHYEKHERINELDHSQGIRSHHKRPHKLLRDKDDYHNHDDDDDDGDRRHKLARELARDIFSEIEIRKNFDLLSDLHNQLIEAVKDPNYDEEKIRDIFTDFGNIFVTNKHLIEEKIVVKMRHLTPKQRTDLIHSFLRNRFYKSFRRDKSKN